MIQVEMDTRAFVSGLKSTVQDIDRATEREESRLARVVVDSANPPVLTGELRDSKFTRPGANGAEFGWGAPHAGFAEYGTEDTPAFGFARAAIQRAVGQLRSPL